MPAPCPFFKPDSGSKFPTLIYLHPEGKSAAALPGGEIEWFVRQGLAVLSPDLSGTGETGSVDDDFAFLGVQIGRSIPGIRAGDVMRCVQYLRSRNDVLSDQIMAIARGGVAVPLLHAAVFESTLRKVALIEPLVSFRSIVMNRYYNVPFADIVPNALRAYDLPDLEACLAPRPLMLVNVRDQLLMPASHATNDQDLGVVRKAYAAAGAQSALIIRNWERFQSMEDVFMSWLKD